MCPDPTAIFRAPAAIGPDTLANLGPLRALAGIWEGSKGEDQHPEVGGAVTTAYQERYELQPIDPQTNGPQLLYGLRYHTHVTRPGQRGTFHDQVGYWLWEPSTETIIHTLSLPRGLIAMAAGHATGTARSFELRADSGSPSYGICSNPFLLEAFKTLEFRISVTLHEDGSWSYEQDTVLKIVGDDQVFHHTDRNTLYRVAAATPNPLALSFG